MAIFEKKENEVKEVANGTIRFVNNPITNDSNLLSYYTDSTQYNREEIFDKYYELGLELMGGDKLLKPASSINLVSIRKTTTPGLYKLILNNPELTFKVRHIDESQLLNNREYCKGTISKLDENSYEVTYFDEEDEINIEHFNKSEVIDFMNKNKLIFQT